MGYSPGLLLKIGQFSILSNPPFLLKIGPIFDRFESTLNQYKHRHKPSRKQSQIILERFWRRFREFGAISMTCQNRPCSKPWAIAQAFCSKSANFRPLRIHPKSTQTSAQALTNHFRTVLQAFQRVWSDFLDLPKSAIFKPWAIAQAFCSKSANFRPLRIHPKSIQTFAQALTNHFRTVFAGVSESLERYLGLAKIGHVQNLGL